MDAQGNIERQFAAVRRFIAERVDAIIIAPVVVTGWTPVLKEARAANVPVFIADRSVDAETSLFVARIGNDTNLEGRLAGSWLAQASRGRCSIVELQGTIGAAPTIGRKAGFATVIAQFPDMPIIRSQSGDFTEAGGRRVMAEFIKSTDGLKDVCAIWAHNDDMMLGAIEVMKSAGLHPGKTVLTISADGVPGIYRAMLKGEANASVEVRADIGKYIFDVVQGYLAGKHDYPKWVLIPTDLHTPEDAAQMLRRHGGSRRQGRAGKHAGVTRRFAGLRYSLLSWCKTDQGPNPDDRTDRPAQGLPHPRSDHGAVWPVRHADPRRLGRRDHQGGEPDRRHLAHLRPVPQPRHERPVHGGKPQQAQHRAGPEASRRQGGAAPADPDRGRAGQQYPARRPHPPWLQLRDLCKALNPKLVYAVPPASARTVPGAPARPSTRSSRRRPASPPPWAPTRSPPSFPA